MRSTIVTVCILGLGMPTAHAEPTELFTELTYAASEMSPPPIDSLAIWYSTMDIAGLAAMPEQVLVEIPGSTGDIVAVVNLERMDRREGFGPRDPYACEHGDPAGCEIVPIPGYPADLFSYTWIGRGDGYDLRLTVHHGNAVGVFSGPNSRFGITWDYLKEIRVEYFLTDDSFVYEESGPPTGRATPTSAAAEWSPAEIQAATIARIEPSTTRRPRRRHNITRHVGAVYRASEAPGRWQSVELPRHGRHHDLHPPEHAVDGCGF